MEEAKKRAAFAAVDAQVEDGMVLGIGSGSTVVYAVERLAQRVAQGEIKVKACIPSSWQATQLIKQYSLPLQEEVVVPTAELLAGSAASSEETIEAFAIDLTIDGADEVDPEGNLIKGGGACQTREKLVAAYSKRLVIVADARKDSEMLGRNFGFVPIEVLPSAWGAVARFLLSQAPDSPIGKVVSVKLRSGGASKAGPCVTDNGNLVLDVNFGEMSPQRAFIIDQLVSRWPGVITTGLFCRLPVRVFFCRTSTGEVVSRSNSLWDDNEARCWNTFSSLPL